MLLPAVGALAHISLDLPADRDCPDEKNAPCGSGCDARSGNVTAFEPGATITVSWTETIDHESHYRISFDDDGNDDFQDPTGYDDIQANPTLPVLLDGIEDRDGTRNTYSVQVTLPDIECDNCTLQLIQVMYDKPPFVPNTNDIYYRCADLTLRRGAGNGDAGPTPPPPADAGPSNGGGGDSGCSAAGQSAPGAALLLVVGALAYVGRRRRTRG